MAILYGWNGNMSNSKVSNWSNDETIKYYENWQNILMTMCKIKCYIFFLITLIFKKINLKKKKFI